MRETFVAILSFLSFAVPHFAFADTNSFTVGKTKIAIPTPSGFFCDIQRNEFVRSLVPKRMKLMARYMVNKSEMPNVRTDRTHNIQVHVDYEAVIVSDAEFQILKDEYRQQYKGMIDTDGQIKELSRKGTAELNRTNRVSLEFQMDEPVGAGVVGESENSILTAMILRAQVSAGKGPLKATKHTLIVLTMTTLRIRGKVLNLYSASRYNDYSDLKWTIQAAEKWRDSIVTANSRSD